MQRCSRNVNAESGFSIDVTTMHVLSLALCYYYIINICSCGTLVNSCNNSCCQWCVHRDDLHWFRDRKCIIEVTFRLLHEWRRNKKILTRNTPLRSEMRRKSRLWRSRADPIIDLRQTLPPRVLGGGGSKQTLMMLRWNCLINLTLFKVERVAFVSLHLAALCVWRLVKS